MEKLLLVDFYTDANIDIPSHALETNESFGEWLKSFVGKEIEIERITPLQILFSRNSKANNKLT